MNVQIFERLVTVLYTLYIYIYIYTYFLGPIYIYTGPKIIGSSTTSGTQRNH